MNSIFVTFCFLSLYVMDLEVVVYKGMIREKPSSKEEAREFIKGFFFSSSWWVSSYNISVVHYSLDAA